MLTEDELRDLASIQHQGNLDPVASRWVGLLLNERRELLAQLDFIRHRIRQAAVYLEGLCLMKEQPRAQTVARERSPRGGTQR
jgi:hypothetical protein